MALKGTVTSTFGIDVQDAYVKIDKYEGNDEVLLKVNAYNIVNGEKLFIRELGIEPIIPPFFKGFSDFQFSTQAIGMFGIFKSIFQTCTSRHNMRFCDNRAKAWQYVLWSLVGFFVIFSMWGLVNVLIGSFGLQSNPSSWSTYFNIFPTQ